MVLPDMQTVLCLHTFVGHARANDFGQSININGIHAECVLNFLTHCIGPGFSAKNTHLQRRLTRIETNLAKLVENRQQIGGRDHDDTRFEILDQRHLALGHAARHRHHGRTQPFGPVMGAQPPGEQPVAIGHMHHVAGPAATGINRAGNHLGPHIHVIPRIADHGGFSGGA